MSLVNTLRHEAIKRKQIQPDTDLDAAQVFYLVRDMPYRRASNREPKTTIQEWCGTCSGKHYLLKALFLELGIESDLIACTTERTIDPSSVPPELGEILKQSDGLFVDVHNYLLVNLPTGNMVVDATWPASTKSPWVFVNEVFELGQNQIIASPPRKSWVVPDDRDPQEFKDEILRTHYTPRQLELRDEFIKVLSKLMAERV